MSQSKLSRLCIDEYRLFIYKAERLPTRRLVWLTARTRATLVSIIGQLVPYDRILRKEKTLEAPPLLTQFCAIVYLQQLGTDVLPWPAQSADLNPIQCVWNYLNVQIGARERRRSSIHELWEDGLDKWAKLPLDCGRILFGSMPKRVAAVLKAKGGQTKY